MNEEKFVCPNCNAEANPEDGFCGNCGCSLTGGATNPTASASAPAFEAVAKKVNPVLQKLQEMPKKKKIIAFGAAAAAVILLTVLIIVLAVNGSYNKLDMKKAVTIEYMGLNSNGKAVVNIDDEYIADFASDVLGIDPEDLEDADLEDLYSSKTSSKYKKAFKLAALLDTIEIECTPNENLSNGDEVTVKVDYNEDKFKDNKIKLKNTEYKVKVEGLSDGTEYDVFKDVKLSFRGVSPDLSVSIDTTECDEFVQRNVSFYLDNSYSVKNGDVITLTASVNESAAESNEYIIRETTKQYTVSGQAEYISSIEGIDMSAVYTEMNDQANAKVASWIGAYDWDIGTVTSAALEGEPTKWMLAKKSSDIYGDDNKFVAIYKCNAASAEGTAVWYIVVEIQDVVKNADGSITWDYINVNTAEGEFSSIKAEYIDSYVNNYTVTEIK